MEPESKTNRFDQQQSSVAMSLSDLKTILGEVDSEEVVQNTHLNKTNTGIAAFEIDNSNVRPTTAININVNNGTTSPTDAFAATSDRRFSGPKSIMKRNSVEPVPNDRSRSESSSNGVGYTPMDSPLAAQSDAPAETPVDIPVAAPTREASRSVTIMAD
eukprot:GILK01017937.1.p1 GENE.GILK01017937.1~~GILK01017937.1.p1  ORF type:complete len:159 (+),score=23.33 GILK01017937.1:536-1012(+)